MPCLAIASSSARCHFKWLGLAAWAFCAAVLAAPGGEERRVTVEDVGPNVIAYWNAVANQTVNATGAVNITPEEQRPSYPADLATLHVAMYDAVSAIDGRYQPFAVTPRASATGASVDAAASAAAFGVLRALFPNRSALYQSAYEARTAAIPEGDAKARGLALGSEVAAAMVALRANDGRSVVLAPYVSGSAPGQFRSAGPAPFNLHVPLMKPFALTSASQFRPAGPPALGSAQYAADFQQSQQLGGRVSSARSAEQFEMARFHAEPPAPFITRNLGRFARSTRDVAEAARLMAWLYVVHADVIVACFEAKYHHAAWRPQSAIPLADTDGNDATPADPAWAPALPTPNHPEYPAAHSCTAGGIGETLYRYHGTHRVSYAFDSTVTGTTRRYTTTEALGDESETARVAGGMHFRFSTVDGLVLGQQVARWVADHHFGMRR